MSFDPPPPLACLRNTPLGVCAYARIEKQKMNEENLKNEDDLKSEDYLKNEDNLKMKTT